MAAPLIQLRKVTKRFDTHTTALRGLTLDVMAGEALAVAGPAGAGKSTLLNMIAGLDRPTSGSVTVDGQPLDRMRETALACFRQRRVGFVLQVVNLLDDLTVMDCLLLPARVAGVPPRRAKARAMSLLHTVGIEEQARCLFASLNGEQRHCVAVAKALMNNPPLLLADRPSWDQSHAGLAKLERLLALLNAAGQTMLVVVPDAADVHGWATRTIELADGAIVRDSYETAGNGWPMFDAGVGR